MTFSLSDPKENVTLDEHLLDSVMIGSPLYDYQIFTFDMFRVKTKRGTTLVQKLRWEITLCTDVPLSRMVERLPFSWSEAISAVAQER